MKKILCVILAVSMLFLASCSGKKLEYGIYHIDNDSPISCKLYYRSESSFAISYGGTSERGTCVRDESKITVDISDSDCIYVFDIKDGKLVYDADNSTPSDKFVSSGLVKDGDTFFVAFESKGK